MDDKNIHLTDLYHILCKHITPIIKFTAFCVIAALLYITIATPIYESEVLVRIKQPKNLSNSILDAAPIGNAGATKQLMRTYAEILKSRSVVLPVITATEAAGKSGIYPRYEEYVRTRITTEPFKDTDLMKISLTYKESPEKAQEAMQLLILGFLDRLTELSREEQKATRKFIEERVVQASETLNDNESALSKYRKENKIISPSDQLQIVANKLGMIDRLEAENKVSLAAAQAKNSAVAATLSKDAHIVADNAAIKQYTAKLGELEAQRIAYLDKYTDKHPRMQEINQLIIELKQKINVEVGRVVSLQTPSDNPVHQKLVAEKFSSQAESFVAQGNLEAIKQLNKTYEDDIGKLSEQEQAFLQLIRNRNISQEIYTMLSKRLEEAKVAEMSVATEVQVIDPPTLPDRPIKPQKASTVVLAALFALVGSSIYFTARDLLNSTVKTIAQIQKITGKPILAQIPDMQSLKLNLRKNKRKQELADIFSKLWRKIWTKN